MSIPLTALPLSSTVYCTARASHHHANLPLAVAPEPANSIPRNSRFAINSPTLPQLLLSLLIPHFSILSLSPLSCLLALSGLALHCSPLLLTLSIYLRVSATPSPEPNLLKVHLVCVARLLRGPPSSKPQINPIVVARAPISRAARATVENIQHSRNPTQTAHAQSRSRPLNHRTLLLNALLHHAGPLLEAEEQGRPLQDQQVQEGRCPSRPKPPSPQTALGGCVDQDLRRARRGAGAPTRLHARVEVQRYGPLRVGARQWRGGMLIDILGAGLDIPFLILPFRPTSDPSAARSFIRNFFDRNMHGETLSQELRLTEPMVRYRVDLIRKGIY